MEPEDLLSCSQEPATSPYPEHNYYYYWTIIINIIIICANSVIGSCNC
jgi:hypothetical protein